MQGLVLGQLEYTADMKRELFEEAGVWGDPDAIIKVESIWAQFREKQASKKQPTNRKVNGR